MQKILTSKQFWLDAGERAVKTFAQVLLALFLSDHALTVLNFHWGSALAAAGTAVVISLLTSIASTRIGPDNTASLVGEPPAVDNGSSGYNPSDDNSSVGGGV